MFNTVPKPRPIPDSITYEIADLPSEFELLWVTSSVDIIRPQNKGSINLVTGDKYAYSLSSVSGVGSLVTINLLTGKSSLARINGNRDEQIGSTRATTLAINSNYLYIGFDGTQKISGDIEWGAGSLKSFDLKTDSQTWTQRIAGSRSLDTVVATEETISVDGSFSSTYFLFDAQHGEILEKREKNSRNFIWSIDDRISYERSPKASFLAVDRQADTIVWESSFSYGIYQPPIFTDKVIVARIGKSYDSGRVIGIDTTNGNILWEYETSISNIEVSNSIVFFITSEVQLVAVDIETGNLIEKISFTPNTQIDNNAFHVAANENMVLVYLGEGQQLMSFRFSFDD